MEIREIVVDYVALGAFTGKSCFREPYQVFKRSGKKCHFPTVTLSLYIGT